MKKLASLTALAAFALSLAGCAGSQHAADESYILVASNLKIPYWAAAAAGLKQAATQLGVKSDVVGPAGYDPKAQREELRRIMARNLKPAGILISPADPVLLKDDIDAAIAQGIPVITIDSDAPTSKRLLYVGTDN
jgi:ribose transport system substrate-binding protein